MADISKITLPSGTTYDIKDAVAREEIATIVGGNVVRFIGVSTTQITDGGTQVPTIAGWSDTVKGGDICFYGAAEFIWGNDSKWHETGDLSSLGDLAYKDTASGEITPSGSVSQPTFTGTSSTVTITATGVSSGGNYTPAGAIDLSTTSKATTFSGTFTPSGTVTVTTKTTTNKTAAVSSAAGTATYTPAGSVAAPTISLDAAGATASIKNPTSTTVAKTVVAAAPGAAAPANAVTYYNVNGETLSLYQLGYTTGDSITTSNVTVKTGDASYAASAPAFTGTGVRLVTGNIAVPSTYDALFTGTQGNVSVDGEVDSVTSATFSGSPVQIAGTVTPSGTVSKPTFTGSPVTVTVS